MKNIFSAFLFAFIFLWHVNANAQFWVYQTSGTTQHLNDVYMINSLTGWIVGDAGTLLKTDNGGQVWTQVNVTGNDLNSITFKDANIGVAVGDGGVILRTVDGGNNWSVVPVGTIEQFRKVSSGAGSMFFASGDAGLAAVSLDDGATWSIKNTGTAERFRGAAAFGTTDLWAVGDEGIIKYSSDAGNTWSDQFAGVSDNDLHDIQFVSSTHGFAGGNSSSFIYTTNSGQSWQLRNTGIFFDVNGIYFQDENVGWGVSIVGTIFFTTDAGLTWTSQPCGSPNTLNEAYFIHQGRGWTVGDNGTVVMYDNPNIPVELSSFSASVSENSVLLNWSTASEVNNLGFEVERKLIADWVKIGFVEGNGTTTEAQSYSYSDKNVNSGTYQYRLKQVDYDGTYEYSNVIEIEVDLTPKLFELSQNYPNPFNPGTKIKYSIPNTGADLVQLVTLKVYDILGNEVAALVNEEKTAGVYEVNFDATELSSGIYLYQINAGQFTSSKKMILIK